MTDINMTSWDGFVDEFVKIATSRLFREFAKAGPAAKKALMSKLPPEMRSQLAYKELGNKARQAVGRGMEEGAGHGKKHVWDVTRDAQEFLGARQGGRALPATESPFSQNTYRRGVLSSLLHDIGRPAESQVLGGLKKQVGKDRARLIMKADPSLAHSELSGRYSKNFLRQNQDLVRQVPGLERGRLSGAIRAHDTDIHKVKPWTKERLKKDPAAATTYLADKAQGMGNVGAVRTIEAGQHFGETPAQTYSVAQKNFGKYRSAIDNFAQPQYRENLNQRLRTYENSMNDFARQHNVIPFQRPAPVSQSPAAMVARSPTPAPVVPLRPAMPTPAQPMGMPRPTPRPMGMSKPMGMPRPAAMPAAPQPMAAVGGMRKVSMPVSTYVRLYKDVLNGSVKPQTATRIMRRLSLTNPRSKTESFAAIFKLPEDHRLKLMNLFTKK